MKSFDQDLSDELPSRNFGQTFIETFPDFHLTQTKLVTLLSKNH